MAKEERLNNGFYWLLLNVIDKTFYQNYLTFELFDEKNQDLATLMHHDLRKEIRSLAKGIENDRISAKHLKWAEQMLLEDAE